MWTLCFLHPVTMFPSKPSSSISISQYRVVAWCPTSKVKWNLCYLAERECVSIWHSAGTWPPNFWQQSIVTLCSFWMNSVHVHHLYKHCLYFLEGRTLPKLPLWDIKIHDDQSGVLPKGAKVRGWLSEKDLFSTKETHPRRTEIPRHKKGSPRHPKDPSRFAAKQKSFMNWLCSQGEQTVWTFQSARGT